MPKHRFKTSCRWGVTIGLLLVCLFSARGLAQDKGVASAPEPVRPRGEVNVGAGGVFFGRGAWALINARVGGPFTDYLGIEASLGAVVRPCCVEVIQGNLVVNLVEDRWSQGKLIPFVTAGLGASVPYPALVINFGGGGKYYFRKHVGLRFDLRDNVFKGFESRGFYHTMEISGGLTIRF